MEILTIEINDPKVKRLLDDMADLGLISIKDATPSWNARWDALSESLPNVDKISEEEILQEIAAVRKDRSIL